MMPTSFFPSITGSFLIPASAMILAATSSFSPGSTVMSSRRLMVPSFDFGSSPLATDFETSPSVMMPMGAPPFNITKEPIFHLDIALAASERVTSAAMVLTLDVMTSLTLTGILPHHQDWAVCVTDQTGRNAAKDKLLETRHPPCPDDDKVSRLIGGELDKGLDSGRCLQEFSSRLDSLVPCHLDSPFKNRPAALLRRILKVIDAGCRQSSDSAIRHHRRGIDVDDDEVGLELLRKLR